MDKNNHQDIKDKLIRFMKKCRDILSSAIRKAKVPLKRSACALWNFIRKKPLVFILILSLLCNTILIFKSSTSVKTDSVTTSEPATTVDEAHPIFDSAIIEATLKDVAQFETQTGVVCHFVYYEDLDTKKAANGIAEDTYEFNCITDQSGTQTDYFDIFINNPKDYYYSNEAYFVKSEISAGIDLNNEDDLRHMCIYEVDDINKVIRISIPDSKILGETTIDTGDWKRICSIDRGAVIPSLGSEELNKLIEQIKSETIDWAGENNIIENANKNAKSVVQNLVLGMIELTEKKGYRVEVYCWSELDPATQEMILTSETLSTSSSVSSEPSP